MTREYVKGYGFVSFVRNLLVNMENNYWMLLLKQDLMLKKLLPKK